MQALKRMASQERFYTVRIEKNILREKATVKTIIIYSPDKDLNVSLSMVLQDFFNVITTEDIETLAEYTALHKADLVIADATPTEALRRRFEKLKEAQRRLRIIMIYVSQFTEKEMKKQFEKVVDEVFYKPIELSELIDSINVML
jgi:DNA-binding response OmpR family regulator